MNPPRVSVIVCTRDRPRFIGDCVRSLLDQSWEDLEVLVLDQSAGEGTGEVLGRLDHPRRPVLRYERTSTRGLSRARNLGLRRSRGEIIAYIDDDAVADASWVRSFVEEYERHPGVGLVFGRVHSWGGNLGGRAVGLLECPERRFFGPRHRIPYGVGGGVNMSLRKWVVDRIGSFDERLGAGGRFRGAEDVDFIFRAFAAGLEVLYSPLPVVYHRHRCGTEEELDRLIRDYNFANGAFIAKHLKAGTPGILRVLVFRLWHYALSAVASGLFRRDPERIRRGLRFLRDHAAGMMALWQD